MGRLVALLIGIDSYPDPVPSLRGCVADVTELAALLRGRVAAEDLDLMILTDAAATRAAVIATIAEHLGRAGPEDVALLHYSGHGSQEPAPEDVWGVEPDRLNETLVLYDSRSPGSWDLADKELAALLRPIERRAGHVLVVLDCCHSGSGTRATRPYTRVRLAPPDARGTRSRDSYVTGAIPGQPSSTATGSTATGSRATGSAIPGSGVSGVGTPGAGASTPARSAGDGHVLLAACRSSETAKETTVDGQTRGALSAVLSRVLREAEGRPTYRDLHRFVTAQVLGLVPDQHPQLEASSARELDRVALGGAIVPRRRQLTLTHGPDGWGIDAGAVHGIPAPVGGDTTELAVYPAAAAQGAALTTATVTRVLPDRSIVTLADALDELATFRAVVTSVPLPPLRVAVTGEEAPAARGEGAPNGTAPGETAPETVPDQGVPDGTAPGEGVPGGAPLGDGAPEGRTSGEAVPGAAAPAGFGDVALPMLHAAVDPTLVTFVDDASGADVIIAGGENGIEILRPGATDPVVTVPSGQEQAPRIATALERIARWRRLADLRNPATRLPPGALDVSVATATGPLDPEEPLEVTYAGQHSPTFTVTVRNTTGVPLWCALLDLTEAYGVFTDAFPAGSVALEPGEVTEVALTGEVPDALWRAGTTSVIDHLKLIVSTLEFDPRSLEQPELDSLDDRTVRTVTSPRSTLERLLGGVVSGPLRSARRVGAARPPVADWSTSDIVMTTHRPR